MYDDIIWGVPHKPTHPMWSDGDTIYCESMALANAMADMIEKIYENNGNPCLCVTGIYDDSLCESKDDPLYGWHYVEME